MGEAEYTMGAKFPWLIMAILAYHCGPLAPGWENGLHAAKALTLSSLTELFLYFQKLHLPSLPCQLSLHCFVLLGTCPISLCTLSVFSFLLKAGFIFILYLLPRTTQMPGLEKTAGVT